MSQSISTTLVGLFVVCAAISCAQSRSSPPAPPAPQTNANHLSGPYSHENLAVYLVHGPNRLKDAKYLTLQEALDQKKVVVHETGNVNTLSIENVGDEDVYIQSGEIVKGGRQDRTLATDMILNKSMGAVPIDAFCVEHGRWTQRGHEESVSFSGGSSAMVAGKEMKLASNSNSNSADQGLVWASVGGMQSRLTENTRVEAQAAASPSSFQLTMENPKLGESVDAYVKPLQDAPEKSDDVIGWVYVVNGKISGGNVYANSSLFKKLWPKLLKSGAVEALAESRKDAPTTQPVLAADVEKFLADAGRGEAKSKEINPRTSVSTCDHADSVLIETKDSDGGEWVHRDYLSK